MRVIGPSSLDEVLAVWLSAELESSRFGERVRELCDVHSIDPATLGSVLDEEACVRRRSMMGVFRGLGSVSGAYLSGFPVSGVRWERVGLSPAELLSVLFVDWSYWLELSGGSRSPVDAAARVEAGVRPFGMSTEGFRRMAEVVRGGGSFPELVVVSAGGAADRCVVVEGHARLTAYALAADAVPAEVSVLLGSGSAIGGWWAY